MVIVALPDFKISLRLANIAPEQGQGWVLRRRAELLVDYDRETRRAGMVGVGLLQPPPAGELAELAPVAGSSMVSASNRPAAHATGSRRLPAYMKAREPASALRC